MLKEEMLERKCGRGSAEGGSAGDEEERPK